MGGGGGDVGGRGERGRGGEEGGGEGGVVEVTGVGSCDGREVVGSGESEGAK